MAAGAPRGTGSGLSEPGGPTVPGTPGPPAPLCRTGGLDAVGSRAATGADPDPGRWSPLGGPVTSLPGYQEQEGGYLTTGTATYSTGGYAVASDPVKVHGLWGWLGRFAGEVQIRVTATSPGQPVFVAIGAAGDVSRYLAGVSYTSVTALGDHDVTQHPGACSGRPRAAGRRWRRAQDRLALYGAQRCCRWW